MADTQEDVVVEGVDLEEEGLLEGVEEGREREDRIALLRELIEQGVSLEELRSAVQEDRLTLLPVEIALTGEGKYTPAEVSEKTGLEEDFITSLMLSLGLPRPTPDERNASDADLEAIQAVKFFLDTGVPREGVLEVTRVLGNGMKNAAGAIARQAGQTLIEPGDTERALGKKFVQAVEDVAPRAAPLMDVLLRVNMREQVRAAILSRNERETGELSGAREVTIAFADLEGFTKLGQKIAPDEVGRVAGRLSELAAGVTEPPVRLVKTIGDAVMLACFETQPLLEAAHALLDAAAEEGKDFPRLSAGLAHGAALPRNGDWYGAPVNLASRVTSEARPGTVLVTDEVKDRVEEGFRFSRLSPRKLKGVKGSVKLWRSRPGEESEEDDSSEEKDSADDAPDDDDTSSDDDAQS